MIILAAIFLFTLQQPRAAIHHLWMEAESFGPLKGSNFSFLPVEQETKGSWSIAGPDTAPSWTQGGESEFMSIAARADEPNEIAVGRNVEIPESGDFRLWVRYADYRNKEEAFGVRVKQSGETYTHVFGRAPVVDDLDPMKLTWGWSYGWDTAPIRLQKGPAHIELYTTGPTEARRCVDCLCITNDPDYHPVGREKPSFAAWAPLQRARGNPESFTERELAVLPMTLLQTYKLDPIPPGWKIADGPPAFVWNVGEPWWNEIKSSGADRMEQPFGLDPPIVKDYLAAFRGKNPPIFSSPLSGPVWHIPFYPQAFADGSAFLDWLNRNPDRRFALLLNYGEPSWPKDADHKAVHANLVKYKNSFTGFIAGEGLSYATVDDNTLNERIRAAKNRRDVLAALRDENTRAVVKKFSDYFGVPLTPEEAWAPVIPCLSANNEAFTHAVADWGVKRIGHENTGNSPTLARRLAFLRGAARQMGVKIADYQSCNLGDCATMFSKEHYFYPASPRYILDNQYDAWAGAGIAWLLRDYLLWHLAGVDAFYNEQGVDLFWKPGGNSAGDGFPVELSPKGRVAETALEIAGSHPRGVQYTPVAFLLDEAHGYSQERFQPGAFGLDPQLNPAVLTPGRHEASIRGWFDIAYYPAPETQGEPSTAIRQTYVNGIFGDIFDVIANVPKRTAILSTYPVTILSGEVYVSEEWGKALHDYMERGGTLVVCAEQLAGEGIKRLSLPTGSPERESDGFVWRESGEAIPSNRFRFHALPPNAGNPIALAADGSVIAVESKRGKGRLVYVSIPLGLGIDERPTPLLSKLMLALTSGLMPIQVSGDVEWTVNRLEDGSWLVSLLNNSGINKPAHGVNPTDHRQSRAVRIAAGFPVIGSEEWIAGAPLTWRAADVSDTVMTVPAGAIRLIHIQPSPK